MTILNPNRPALVDMSTNRKQTPNPAASNVLIPVPQLQLYNPAGNKLDVHLEDVACTPPSTPRTTNPRVRDALSPPVAPCRGRFSIQIGDEWLEMPEEMNFGSDHTFLTYKVVQELPEREVSSTSDVSYHHSWLQIGGQADLTVDHDQGFHGRRTINVRRGRC